MQRRGAHFLLAAALASACAIVQADEIVLRNGDRITGEAVAKSADRLVVRTGYAGEISIAWREIVSITTRAPVELVLEGEPALVRGQLVPAPAGRFAVETAEARRIEAPLDAVAFLNPKPYEAGTGIAYTGRAALAAAVSSGNVDSRHVHGRAELEARAREHRTRVSARIEQRAEEGEESAVGWLTNTSHDRFLDPRRFVYARGALEHDRAKDLRRRAAGGAGYGVQLADGPRARLSLRGGLDYVVESRYDAAGERYPALGWGLEAAATPWGPRLELFHEHYGLRNLERDAVVLRSKSGLRVPLVTGMSATGQLNVDWESRPPPGRASTDTTLLFGVDYAW
ncbi:MAG TPA: DUF481 domain-containing protein [Burkholderiales bacterium]|nr:DUF481 domain-containing protein [Burkholderiales bacterium]